MILIYFLPFSPSMACAGCTWCKPWSSPPSCSSSPTPVLSQPRNTGGNRDSGDAAGSNHRRNPTSRTAQSRGQSGFCTNQSGKTRSGCHSRELVKEHEIIFARSAHVSSIHFSFPLEPIIVRLTVACGSSHSLWNADLAPCLLASKSSQNWSHCG